MATIRQRRKNTQTIYWLSQALEQYLEKKPMRGSVHLVDSGQLDEQSLKVILESIVTEILKTKERKQEENKIKREEKRRRKLLEDAQRTKRPRGRPRKK